MPRSSALRRTAAGVDPRPVVHQRDHDLARLLRGREQEGAGRRLAAGHAGRGGLDAVVDGVADEVHERLADLVDHRLVHPGVLALQDELDLLALLAGEVAHQPREALEDVADGQHPHVHDRLLQLRRDARHLADGLEQLRPRAGHHVGDLAGQLVELRAVDDQLADQVQQVVELGEVDPHHARAGGGERPRRRTSSPSRAGAASGRAARRRRRRGPSRSRSAPRAAFPGARSTVSSPRERRPPRRPRAAPSPPRAARRARRRRGRAPPSRARPKTSSSRWT